MDRILIICGSAGRGGVTETMCQAAADRFRERNHDVRVVFPSEMRIGHCTGCDGCVDGRCVIDDDMSVLYRLFSESDFLILASPLHFNGPSSLAKTVMDRFQPYWYGERPHPMALAVMLCAGSDSPNFGPAESIIKAFALTTRMKMAGFLEIPGTDSTGDEGVRERVYGFVDGFLEKAEGRSSSVYRPPSPEGSG